MTGVQTCALPIFCIRLLTSSVLTKFSNHAIILSDCRLVRMRKTTLAGLQSFLKGQIMDYISHAVGFSVWKIRYVSWRCFFPKQQFSTCLRQICRLSHRSCWMSMIIIMTQSVYSFQRKRMTMSLSQ